MSTTASHGMTPPPSYSYLYPLVSYHTLPPPSYNTMPPPATVRRNIRPTRSAYVRAFLATAHILFNFGAIFILTWRFNAFIAYISDNVESMTKVMDMFALAVSMLAIFGGLLFWSIYKRALEVFAFANGEGEEWVVIEDEEAVPEGYTESMFLRE